MTHAEDAERLAKKIEKDEPAMAGVIHALLAIAESRTAGDVWNKLDDYDDLPWQLEQDYIFQYADGEQTKWRLSADNPSSVYTFYSPQDKKLWVDPNELADKCVRWRYA